MIPNGRNEYRQSCLPRVEVHNHSLSPNVNEYLEVSDNFLVCPLDPLSPRVPEDLRTSWVSEDEVYKLSRNFCYAIHKKRTKLMEDITETN